MLKKIAIAALAIIVVASIGLFFWARSVFTQDAVRETIARQLSEAVGQPVTIGSVAAKIYPRVTMRLENVAIGAPPRIQVHALDVGTDFRALLSRRIERADLHLNGARIELPLPPLGAREKAPAPRAESPGGAGQTGPVELVSIDEIVLNGVEIVSAGRTLRGDIELVPQGKTITLRKFTLAADDTTITATGALSDPAGPVGELAIKAGTLNIDRLLAFMSDFSGGAGAADAPSAATSRSAPATATGMHLTVSLDAERATMGKMVIDKLSGRAIVKNNAVSLSPLSFGLFGGRYEGTLDVVMSGGTPTFHWKAALSGLDIAKAATFAGRPNTASGRFDGRIDLTGRGADTAAAIQSARGTVRVDATNGVINNLGLVRAVVAATTLSADAVKQGASGPRDEPYARLGATLAIAGGSATTQDLKFESNDLSLTAGGAMKLDGSSTNLQGQLQLSEALSKQASVTVVRATQQGGRVTLPATVTGEAGKYSVSINTGDMAKRAMKNEAETQSKKALSKGLDSLFKKK